MNRERTHSTNDEVKVVQIIEFRSADLEKTGVIVHGSSSSLLVLREGVGSDKNKSGASVNNASGLAEDGASVVGDALVDTPVFICWTRAGERGESNTTGELGGISSTKGKFTICYRIRGSGLE